LKRKKNRQFFIKKKEEKPTVIPGVPQNVDALWSLVIFSLHMPKLKQIECRFQLF